MIIKPRKPKTFGMQESSFKKEVYSNIILTQGTKQNNLKPINPLWVPEMDPCRLPKEESTGSEFTVNKGD